MNARTGIVLVTAAIAAVTAVVAIALAIELLRTAPPPVTPAFVRVLGGGIHRNPYGRFEVTNHTRFPVVFELTVEAPSDPHLLASQGLSSFYGRAYTVPPAGVVRVDELVASGPGIPFRALVDCRGPVGIVGRVWLRLAGPIPVLQRIWDPAKSRRRTVVGAWSQLPETAPVVEHGSAIGLPPATAVGP